MIRHVLRYVHGDDNKLFKKLNKVYICNDMHDIIYA